MYIVCEGILYVNVYIVCVCVARACVYLSLMIWFKTQETPNQYTLCLNNTSTYNVVRIRINAIQYCYTKPCQLEGEGVKE